MTDDTGDEDLCNCGDFYDVISDSLKMLSKGLDEDQCFLYQFAVVQTAVNLMIKKASLAYGEDKALGICLKVSQEIANSEAYGAINRQLEERFIKEMEEESDGETKH